MGITAKELAEKLGISAAAVSLALNDKPGVSAETRKRIKVEAEKYGYDFSKIKPKKEHDGSILFLVYKKSGAVVSDTPFFAGLYEGIARGCHDAGYRLKVQVLYESDFTERTLEDIQYSDCAGLILLGTEMMTDDLKPFLTLPTPLVVLDSYFENFTCDTVLINNRQGAYLATRHLIRSCKSQPGYLRSSYPINNFQERADGFYTAIHAQGMSSSQSLVHELTPSLSGAYEDMKRLLERREPIARCYFADNDLIAVGAIRAMREAGLRVPEDVAVVGFDNLPLAQMVDPPLTTVNVPQQYMGELAALRLAERIQKPNLPVIKTEVSVSLVDRYSC